MAALQITCIFVFLYGWVTNYFTFCGCVLICYWTFAYLWPCIATLLKTFTFVALYSFSICISVTMYHCIIFLFLVSFISYPWITVWVLYYWLTDNLHLYDLVLTFIYSFVLFVQCGAFGGNLWAKEDHLMEISYMKGHLFRNRYPEWMPNLPTGRGQDSNPYT